MFVAFYFFFIFDWLTVTRENNLFWVRTMSTNKIKFSEGFSVRLWLALSLLRTLFFFFFSLRFSFILANSLERITNIINQKWYTQLSLDCVAIHLSRFYCGFSRVYILHCLCVRVAVCCCSFFSTLDVIRSDMTGCLSSQIKCVRVRTLFKPPKNRKPAIMMNSRDVDSDFMVNTTKHCDANISSFTTIKCGTLRGIE